MANLVSRTYGPHEYVVTSEATTAYALATNDKNLQYFDDSTEGGPIAPPLFAVVPQFAIATDLISDLNLPFERILHGEQDMRFVRPIRPGDTLVTDGEIVDVLDVSTGQAIHFEVVTRNLNGEDHVRTQLTLFVRHPGSFTKSRNPGNASLRKPPTPAIAKAELKVDPRQPSIYASASGDHNPPHVDEDFAKSIGFRGVILQGLCTMAFASQPVVNELCEGDSRRLMRLKGRFSNVVYPGDTLTTLVWRCEEDLSFETTNQDGVPVIKDGLAELRPFSDSP